MDLSHSVRKWFYVTDIANSVDTLSRLHTKGISLASDDIVYLVNKLKLKEYSWDQGVAPRVRNLIQSEDRDTPSDNSRDQSSAPIKYTLHDQMEKKFKGVLAPYLFFYGTVIICLAIAFHIRLPRETSLLSKIRSVKLKKIPIMNCLIKTSLTKILKIQRCRSIDALKRFSLNVDR